MDSDDLHRQGSDSEGPGPPAKCIEGLPVEIQRQIMLCIPSLASLGAITRASPVFYSLFQSEPKNFIANCLILGLGDAFLDASTAQAAMQDDFQRQRADAMRDHRELGVVWPFLESYRKRVAELPCNAWIHSISLPEAVQMARFHTSTVEPLVEQYASWALGNIGTPVAPAALSRTETMRIQRAMYRFQIVCNVFGNRIKHDSLSSHRAQSLGCLRFLSGYEPWEIEEILCINAFFQEQYEGKLAETSYDLIPRRDSLSSHPLFGEREQEIDFEEARTFCLWEHGARASTPERTNMPTNHTLTQAFLTRHKGTLPQLPRKPGPPAPAGRAAHRGPRGPRARLPGQPALARVRHVAGRHNRQHEHARAVGAVLLGARRRAGRGPGDAVPGGRPRRRQRQRRRRPAGLAAAGVGAHLGRDV